jgi:hypothetical protein
MRDELVNSFGRKRGMYKHDVGLPVDTCDWCNIADEIERELFIERRISRVSDIDHKQGIAIRGCLHDRLNADIATCTWTVLNNEWSAKALRKPLTEQARQDVG